MFSKTSLILRRSRALAIDMEERGGGAGGGAHLAVIAGIFATGGSTLGKLAGGAEASSLVSWRPIRIADKTADCGRLFQIFINIYLFNFSFQKKNI